ncbi:MAG: cytochrome c class [Caulobacteraceae bacterium]|nr:cytochrome c class [Caulobacteraceae bacterium]
MRSALVAAAVMTMALVGTPGAPAQTTAEKSAGGDAAAGEDLFLDRCAMCHVAEGGGQGPGLKGVYGRKAASTPGFAYSAALKASGVTWTAPELDRFLTNPSAAIPGTAMPITVPDARQRADLIAYFAAQK